MGPFGERGRSEPGTSLPLYLGGSAQVEHSDPGPGAFTERRAGALGSGLMLSACCTRAMRIVIERLAWPHGRLDRPPDPPSSPPIHELATLDVFAAFLWHGDPLLREGLA